MNYVLTVCGPGFSPSAGQTYQDLEVRQVAMDLAVGTYRLSGILPETERYGLIS